MNGPSDKDRDALAGDVDALLDTLTEAAVAIVVDNMTEMAGIAGELSADQRTRVLDAALHLGRACEEAS